MHARLILAVLLMLSFSGGSAMANSDEERVKQILSHIHGFPKEELDKLGINIDNVLRSLIIKDIFTVRSIEALSYYPTAENLDFIMRRLAVSGPEQIKAFLRTLDTFYTKYKDKVLDLIRKYIGDPDLGVRFAVVSLADKLGADSDIQEILKQHLAVERDSELREEIRTLLKK